MMDRITQSLLKEFISSHGLTSIDETQAFEHFANYAVLFGELSDSFELDDVSVGQDGNIGIDGLAIIVNGTQVSAEQDAESIIKGNGYLDADFVFIQAKTSSSFDMGDMAKFFIAVSDFFTDTPQLTHSNATIDLVHLKNYLYDQSSKMKNNPNVSMFYVCTGTWAEDRNLKVLIEKTKKQLKQTRLFNEVTFTPIDASELQKRYRATKGKSSSRFTFQWKVALPPNVNGISEAHFGLVPAKEYLALICDDNGNIKKSLFYDNVRDFQDFNEVNKDIRATLQSQERSLFPLLNNGVTIIAAKVRPTGNIFHIEDYQIVNGCQTSHVLFHEKDSLSDDVYVPIKIISTTTDSVVNKIIKATNFQTQVKPDQLYALSEFQKTLEEYYNTFDGEERLYYERRSKQYAAITNVEKVRIVTIQQQIRAFVSMFLNEPHHGHYPRASGPKVGVTLFGRNHYPDPYYLCALTQFKLEFYFRSGLIDKKYKPARYHLLMGARHILLPIPIPRSESREMKRFCSQLLKYVQDDKKLETAFKNAALFVDVVRGKKMLDRKLTKTQPFTKKYEKALLKSIPLKKGKSK